MAVKPIKPIKAKPIPKPKTYKGKSLKLGGGGRFMKLTDELMAEGKDDKQAKAIAASVGRKQLGKAKFQALAVAGRKRAGKK